MKALSVFNRQNNRAVDASFLRKIAICLLEEFCREKAYEIAIYLIGPSEMAQLNETYLQHEGSTDVITFDYSEAPDSWRGEIFISVADAVLHAARFRSCWQEEVVRYVVHGFLHLAGCEDGRPALRRVMKRRENKLLKELSQRFVLRKLARRKND